MRRATTGRGSWNHNTHYHRLVLRSMPRPTQRALDVGCGEGHLLAALAEFVPQVVGIDADEPILQRASAAAPAATTVHGDFLTHPLQPASFDLVAAIASLHHMDFPAALSRFAELLRPGGVAVVVGLARPRAPGDFAVEAAGVGASRTMRLLRGHLDVQAPTVWPPPMTYAECRRVAADVLPGAVFRRRLYFRYSIVWTKPTTG